MNDSARFSPTTLAVLIPAAVAVLVALPSIGNGFVYDDNWVIEGHEVVHSLSAPGELLRAPYWPGGVIWRPVALMGYALQWAIGDGSPLVFHGASILMYGVLSGLVGLLAARLFDDRIGVFAGVLFAVHPVHAEVVANVVGQAELLAAIGYVVALLAAMARSRNENVVLRAGLLIAACSALAFGLGGKEHVVTIPGALLVVWWISGRNRGVPFHVQARREWPVLAGFVAVIGVYLIFRAELAVSVTNAGGVAAVFEQRSALGRGIVMLPVSLIWLRVLFVPIWLSADYSIQHLVPQPNFGGVHAAAVLLWTAIAVLAWRFRHSMPALLAGCLLFAVMISVVSSVVVPLEILFAERFLFLPSLGWAIAVAGVGLSVREHPVPRVRQAAWAGAGAVAILFGVRAAERATVWRSNDVFFENLSKDAPLSYRGHWAAGVDAFQRGDSVLGEREMRTAIQLNPHRADLLEQLGRIYAASGRHEPAIPLLARAVELDSTLLQSSLALAVSLARTGRPLEGLDVLDQASEIHGEVPGLLLVQGEVFKRAGQPRDALDALRRMIQHQPTVWRIRLMAAEAAALAGLCEEAYTHLDAARAGARGTGLTDVEAVSSWVANGNALCK